MSPTDPRDARLSEAPCVSVVVPFFNRDRHIAECVKSLLAQEDVGGPVELILVDNRSTDDSAGQVAQFPGVVVLEEHTMGAYAARNTGIRRARAPILAFTDADCVVDRHWLRSVRDAMQDPSVAIVLGDCRYPRHASPALRLLAAYENAKTEYVTTRCPAPYRFAHANNMAVRASVFEELGLFKEWTRAADTELVHRLAAGRPDLRTVYCPSMRVTHEEFVSARQRLRRLSLYTETNARVETFRELGLVRRLGVLAHLVRRLVG